MSSTRESVSAVRDEPSSVNSLRLQLKDSQDMVADMQKISELNKQAIKMMFDTSPNSQSELVKNLRNENEILFKSLSRTLRAKKVCDESIQALKNKAESSEEMLRMVRADMTTRITSMMTKMNKLEGELLQAKSKKSIKNMGTDKNPQLSSDRSHLDARETINRLQEMEQMENILVANREQIKRLKSDKKELLKTNFKLSTEIVKMKALLSTSTGYKQFLNQTKKAMPDLKGDLNEEVDKIINFHKKYLGDEIDHDNYSDKSEGSLPNLETEGNEMMNSFEIDEKSNPKPSFSPSPIMPKMGMVVRNNQNTLKLDLTKAKEIQHEVAKKLMEKHNNKEGAPKPDKSEKVEQLELENERLMKMVQKEFSNAKILKKDNYRLRKLNSELITINEVLINANKNMHTKVNTLNDELKCIKTEQLSYINALTADDIDSLELDKESALHKFLRHLVEYKLKPLSSVNSSGLINVPEDRNLRKQRTSIDAHSKEVRKELASQLKQEVSRLNIVRKGSKGDKVSPSHRVTTEDNRKSWSFCEDNEKQETNFDSKRDNLENSLVLEGL